MYRKLLQWNALPILCAAITLSVAAGCDGTDTAAIIDALTNNSNSNPDPIGNGPNEPLPPPDPDATTITLTNASDFALDVQFFTSTDPAVTSESDLLSEDNQFRNGIGFLSLGILSSGESVDISLACSDFLFVGTAGGEFLDANTGESIAVSTRSRLAQLGPQFDCGNRVTFLFFADSTGTPTTALSIE